MAVLKRIAAHLPSSMQDELRRIFFRRQIRRRTFFTDEKEYALLDTLLKPGDWALDVGANVGHYTMRISELVGAAGRVIAFEPVPSTFAVLAANVCLFQHSNVSLLNFAVSDGAHATGMHLPDFDEGLKNYYQASITREPQALTVLTLPIDALAFERPIALVKMDVEGHELPALRGMRGLMEKDHPVLIVETGSAEVTAFIETLGYVGTRLPGSSNVLFRRT